MEYTNEIYIKELILSDYKCFKGNHSFSFVRLNEGKNSFRVCQWTVFLGNNGTGKTNLLRCIANMQPQLVDVTNDASRNQDIPNFLMKLHVTYENESAPDTNDISPLQYQPKVVDRYNGDQYSVNAHFVRGIAHSKSVREGKTCHDLFKHLGGPFSQQTKIGYGKTANYVDDDAALQHVKIFGYGIGRRVEKSGLNAVQTDAVASLFSENVTLMDLEDWLLQLKLAASVGKQKEKAKKRLELLEQVFSTSGILPGLKGFELKTDVDSLNSHIEFRNEEGTFRLKELGSGYQCMLSWLFDFCKRMFDLYPNSINPLHEAAIVLIDEIDLHLHPKWQRTLLKDLSAFFPNVQFIVSTHSPLIVQSLSDINLFVMRPNQEGGIMVERFSDYKWEGWNMEDILREVMDIEGAMTSETLQKEIVKFNKAFERLHLQEAEAIFNRLSKALNANSGLYARLNRQMNELKHFLHEKD